MATLLKMSTNRIPVMNCMALTINNHTRYANESASIASLSWSSVAFGLEVR